MRSFFATSIRHQYLPHGHGDDHGGPRRGGAVGQPGRERNLWRELLQLAPTGPYIVGRRTVAGLRLLAAIDALHPKEPHWYLCTLGTEPDRQGRGVGSSLLAEGLARVDEEGMPAYLESSKERNLPLYARFGFEVVGEIRGPAGAPPMWRMWREPRVPDLPVRGR